MNEDVTKGYMARESTACKVTKNRVQNKMNLFIFYAEIE